MPSKACRRYQVREESPLGAADAAAPGGQILGRSGDDQKTFYKMLDRETYSC